MAEDVAVHREGHYPGCTREAGHTGPREPNAYSQPAPVAPAGEVGQDRRGKWDRLQWDDDGDTLDEIVLSGVTFHIERMSQHGWWLGVDDRATGEHLSMWWSATGEPVLEHDFRTARSVIRGPLLYHGPAWADRKGGRHRCEVEKPDHVRCRCECGATRKNPEREEADR